tara:strand:- start:1006 stop:1530 length:525 start_codon:yes stop_codon:yes gene_type:complete
MKSKENIVFLGMMGAGKTSIGFLVSKKLNLDFLDIDQLIEKELGMKISKIFETKGEKYFREIEEKITLKSLKIKKIVISLGGGAFLNKNIRDEILSNHSSYWLKLNSKMLIKRIRNNSKRPIAFKLTNNELIDLIKKRSNIYSKALYKIDCDNRKKNEIVNEILDIYETNKINS